MKKQTYYYEWGNEPAGHVTIWHKGKEGEICYPKKRMVPRCKLPKGAKFDCPYP